VIEVPLGLVYGFPAVIFVVALVVGFGTGRIHERIAQRKERER
jgi:hypothetical protein